MNTTISGAAFAVWIVATVLLALACIIQALLLLGLRNELRQGIWATATANLCRKVQRDASGSHASITSQKTPSRRKSVLQRLRSSGTSSANENQTDWEVDISKLKMKHIIGKGNFGEVWLATWLGSPVAVKTLLSKLQNKEKIVKRFLDEIRMMSTLHHPNVVMFLGACTVKPNLCLVLEYCVHGSLHHFLKAESKHGVTVTMSLVLRFALDIARGVYYLHRKQSIVQRDLKARNILIDSSLNAKVADFGLSRVLDDDENKLTACGTPAWTAPEVVRLEAYTDKVDVYSFGIILWELLTRDEPYGGQKGVQIAYAAAEQGLRPEVPSYCPEDYKTLMTSCWADSPDDRPGFGSVLKQLFQMKKEADAEMLGDLTSTTVTTGTSPAAAAGVLDAKSGVLPADAASAPPRGQPSPLAAGAPKAKQPKPPAHSAAAQQAVDRGIISKPVAVSTWDGTVESESEAETGGPHRRRTGSFASGNNVVAVAIDDSDGGHTSTSRGAAASVASGVSPAARVAPEV